MLKNIIKKNKWYAKMKRIVKLPQVQLFTVLLMLAVIMIIISSCMTNSFWSLFFSNISAGLFTGLVICFIGGRKAVYINRLEEEKTWLEQLHNMILEFFEMMAAFKKKEYGDQNEYEFVYDLVCKANWVNEFISQSQFDKNSSFDGNLLCKEKLGYDSYSKIEELLKIREEIIEENWNRKDIVKLFESVDKDYWLLNHNVYRKIESINSDISTCGKSII